MAAAASAAAANVLDEALPHLQPAERAKLLELVGRCAAMKVLEVRVDQLGRDLEEAKSRARIAQARECLHRRLLDGSGQDSQASWMEENAACNVDVTARLMSGKKADFRIPPDISIQDLRRLIASKLPVPLRMQRIVVGAEEVKWPRQWAPIVSGASAAGQRIEITLLCRSGLQGSWTSERCNLKLVIDGSSLSLKHGCCPGSTFAARQSARMLRRRLGTEKAIDMTMISDGHFQADQGAFTCDLRLAANGLALYGTVRGDSVIFKRDD